MNQPFKRTTRLPALSIGFKQNQRILDRVFEQSALSSWLGFFRS